MKVKEGALDKSRADLEHCTFNSPIDGVVISRSVDVGQTVAASLQAPVIFTIANDLSKMQIHFNVAEADVGAVEVDQDRRFHRRRLSESHLPRHVAQVRNRAHHFSERVTYEMVVGVDNPDLKFKTGMTANVSIIIAHRDDALSLSECGAAFSSGGYRDGGTEDRHTRRCGAGGKRAESANVDSNGKNLCFGRWRNEARSSQAWD